MISKQGPGGFVDEGETSEAVALRELEEESGWRAQTIKHLASLQPLAGSMDAANDVYLAENLEDTGQQPDSNEVEHVAWVSLKSIPDRIAAGEIIDAGARLGLLHAVRLRG